MTIDLTAPQDAFIYCEDKHRAIVGGLGSGKSKAGTLRLIRLLLADPRSEEHTSELQSLREI